MQLEPRRAQMIFAGGVVGTLLRVVLTGGLELDDWPTRTLLVNLIGTAILAVWIGAVEFRSEASRDAIQIGLLGSFTTFSALAVEVTQLLDEPLKAISYGVVSIGAGLLIAVGGLALGERMSGRLGMDFEQ